MDPSYKNHDGPVEVEQKSIYHAVISSRINLDPIYLVEFI